MKVHIERRKMFALVSLTFSDGTNSRRALMTMNRDIQPNDPKIQEFKRRTMHIGKPT